LKAKHSILTVLLSIVSLWGVSQSLKDYLQGEWLNYKVTLDDGRAIHSDLYARYIFRGGNLFVSNTPIDKGIFQSIKYTKDGMQFLDGYRVTQEFRVETLGGDSVVLATTNEFGTTLHYYFVNQKVIKDITDTPKKRVYEFTVAVFDQATGFNKLKRDVSLNSIHTNEIFTSAKKSVDMFLPPPAFRQDEGKNFATYFNTEFILKKAVDIDSTDNRVVIEFVVHKRGISDIRIVNKVNYEISGHLFLLLEKSGKFWELPKERHLPSTIPVRLEFVFIAGVKNPDAINPKNQ